MATKNPQIHMTSSKLKTFALQKTTENDSAVLFLQRYSKK